MRRSPRRPLILKRRKLPFQQNDSTAAGAQSRPAAAAAASSSKEPPPASAASHCFPDGIRIMNHPSMSDTRVVVIPKAADLQAIIGVLTAKGKESGAQGPNKFILLSENSDGGTGPACQVAPDGDGVTKNSTDGQLDKVETFHDASPLTGSKPCMEIIKKSERGPLDDSLTNIQWLGKMSTSPLKEDGDESVKENSDPKMERGGQTDAGAAQQPLSERPPYSYMAMIQFAINSRQSKKMTLKDIYTWIEDHFPYFKEVAKPGWKNSIRHNLSLHDMFIRETTADNKVSFWTIRPEVNRCLTLDQVYKPDCDPATTPVPLQMLLYSHQQQKRALPDIRRTSVERRIKPLLPRTESYLVPIQLPIASPVYLPPAAAQFPASVSQQKRSIPRATKRVRIAPKVPVVAAKRKEILKVDVKEEVKEEPVCVPVTRVSPRRQTSSSRRKQRLVHSLHEEPVLLCPDNTLFDSGVASDASTFHDAEQDEREPHSPEREFSFKTPIKSGGQLTSSTPSKPTSHALPEPWKVTPVGKGSQSLLDFSPIRTPGGPAVTPRHEYNTFSFNSTPFKDWALLGSPREPHASSRAAGSTASPGGCSRSLLQAGGATPTNRSLTEGLVLDTMNDSLSKILVDISFSGLDDEELGLANISWSEFIPQGM